MDQQPPQEPSPVQGHPNFHAALRSIGEGLINLTGGKKESGWLPPAGWMWGVAPILFAALRVLVVSRGDPETLRALVQNLNATALVLATVLPFGAVLAVLATFSLFIRLKSSGGQTPKGGPFLLLVLVAVTAILVLWTMPVWQFGAAIGFVLAGVVLYFGVKAIAARAQKTRANGVPKTSIIILVIGVILAVLFSPIIYLIGWSGMWLPEERITVADSNLSPVYILSSDERWTSYMDERRKVEVARTSDITRRDAVGPSGWWLDKSLAENASDVINSLGQWLSNTCYSGK